MTEAVLASRSRDTARPRRAKPRELKLLGYRLHPMTKADVMAAIEQSVAAGTRLIMANLNLHGMALLFDSKSMTHLLSQRDALVMIDSMPLVWLAQLFGHYLPRATRMTSLDYFDDLFRCGAERGWRFDYVGSRPDVMERGLARLRERMPGLNIEGRHGYFDIDDDRPGSPQDEILTWLKERSSDALIVGMGMPRQEEWIAKIQARIPTRVLIPVGAYLEYQVGALPLTPRWMGQIGVEWLYRLVVAPRRMGHRYLVEPFQLVLRLMFQRHPQRDYWQERRGSGPATGAHW